MSSKTKFIGGIQFWLHTRRWWSPQQRRASAYSGEYLLLPWAYLCIFVRRGDSQCLPGFCYISALFIFSFGLFFNIMIIFEIPNTPLVAASPHLELEITIIVCRDTAWGRGGGNWQIRLFMRCAIFLQPAAAHICTAASYFLLQIVLQFKYPGERGS